MGLEHCRCTISDPIGATAFTLYVNASTFFDLTPPAGEADETFASSQDKRYF